jgi:hypothetical protein
MFATDPRHKWVDLNHIMTMGPLGTVHANPSAISADPKRTGTGWSRPFDAFCGADRVTGFFVEGVIGWRRRDEDDKETCDSCETGKHDG